jgi:hypothetical protein
LSVVPASVIVEGIASDCRMFKGGSCKVSFPLNTEVRATDDIRRFRTIVVARGSAGRVVDVQPKNARILYAVEFPIRRSANATVTIPGLSEIELTPAG